jgi:hypothetical protein
MPVGSRPMANLNKSRRSIKRLADLPPETAGRWRLRCSKPVHTLRRRPRTGLQKFAVIEAGLGHRSHFFHVGRR